MKLAEHNNSLQTNTDNDSQEFGIGDASIVIEILRNRLYKHKIRTLVQEYISNARDASREVGSIRDIKVSMPTSFDPTFRVRDFGPGISPDRIKNVFVLYGSSTKRDSNNQTGGFGIGAKSAWSYTDSFTIVTHIDGIKRTYLAHTGLNNNGKLDILSETTTTEDNGTEIQIGVNPDDITKFQVATQRAIHFWSENVELSGLDMSKNDLVRGVEIDKGIEIVDKSALDNYNFNWNERVLLAIDGIIYPVDRDLYNVFDNFSLIEGTLIVHIPTGKVDVSASREEISITTENETILSEIFKNVDNKISQYMTNKMNSVKSISDKIAMACELNKILRHVYETNGYIINRGSDVSHKDFADVSLIKYSIRRGNLQKEHINDDTRGSSRYNKHISINNLYTFDNTESIVKRNMRIKEFLGNNNSITVLELKDSDTVIYNKFKKELPFQDLKSLTYTEKVKVIGKPKTTRSNTEFCMHVISRHWGVEKTHTTLDKVDKMWYYVELDGMSFPIPRDDLKSVVNSIDINICGLSKGSVKRVKDDSNFIELTGYLKTLKPTSSDIVNIKKIKAVNKRYIKYIDMDVIKNVKLKALNNEYNTFKDLQYKELPVLLNHWNDDKSVIEFIKRDTVATNIFKRCPLLDVLSSYETIDTKEVTFYINSKLNQRGSK